MIIVCWLYFAEVEKHMEQHVHSFIDAFHDRFAYGVIAVSSFHLAVGIQNEVSSYIM